MKQIFAYTEPEAPAPGEYVQFLQAFQHEETKEIVVSVRDMMGNITSITLPLQQRIDLAVALVGDNFKASLGNGKPEVSEGVEASEVIAVCEDLYRFLAQTLRGTPGLGQPGSHANDLQAWRDRVGRLARDLRRDGLAPKPEVSALVAACADIDADYMTSEHHHPGYVLIPTAKFEEICDARPTLEGEWIRTETIYTSPLSKPEVSGSGEVVAWQLADPLPKEIPLRLGDWRDTKAALEALIPGYMQLPEDVRKALWGFSEALPKVHPEMSFKCCECEQLFSRVHQYRCADCHATCCPDCIRPHFGPNHKPHGQVASPINILTGLGSDADQGIDCAVSLDRSTGWQSVPTEPTDAMKYAGGITFENTYFGEAETIFDAAGAMFKAMIDAAPVGGEK